MILGRLAERATIDSVLDRARAGHGGGLVIHGEPGIGKTTLLGYAAGRADGMTVLSTRGVEPEADIGYAALHQMLLPLTDRIAALPEPQAQALDIVFGRAAGLSPDRFLVALAVLSLLSDAAVDRPVLCLADDAQWIDRETCGVLAFVARRLGTDRVALLLAARADEGHSLDRADLPELPLGGLDHAAARELLGDRLPPDQVGAVVRATGGNPLAIRELPAAGWLGDPAEPIPLAADLRRTFLQRARRHGPDLRLLLLAAADGTGRLDILERAATVLGVDSGPLTTDRLDDLLAVDSGRLTFRHPLMRAAIYHGATAAGRRAVHDALATAWTDDATSCGRRAWHLGRAAAGPDETIAQALEDAADTLGRAGAAAAAAAMERAAELSGSTPCQARRMVAAAEAWWAGGNATRAGELLDRAEALGPHEEAVRLDALALRATLQVRAGSPADAIALLSPAIPTVVAKDRPRAIRLLMLLGEAGYQSNGAAAFAQAGAAVAELGISGDDETALLARMCQANYLVRSGRAGCLSTADRFGLGSLSDPVSLAWAGGMAYGIGEPDLGRALRHRAVDRARRLGAAGTLAWILDYVVAEELGRSRLGMAEALAEEGLRFAIETGQPNVACRHRAALAMVAAVRGNDDDARRLVASVLAESTERGLDGVGAAAYRALALLDLAAGRPADALALLSTLDRGNATHPGVALQAVPDKVEAAVLAGAAEAVTGDFQRYADWAAAAASPHLLALSARCTALLGPADAAEAGYRRAVTLHRKSGRSFEYARTELLLGEHLRRRRQRHNARIPLRAALEVFSRLGAQTWAQRTRAELRAAGEHIPTASVPAAGALSLTPQEARIVDAVREGLTNREIAAQLFLSPRTVDYHLRKIFRSMGITARAQLLRLDVQVAPGPPHTPTTAG